MKASKEYIEELVHFSVLTADCMLVEPGARVNTGVTEVTITNVNFT